MIGQHSPVDPQFLIPAELAEMRRRIDELERVVAASTEFVEDNYTTITPATNFSATLNMRRSGKYAALSVVLTRTGSNVAAWSNAIATIGDGGRGTMSTFTQALNFRATSLAGMEDAVAWLAAATGVITVDWPVTWTTGSSVTFTGVVLLG